MTFIHTKNFIEVLMSFYSSSSLILLLTFSRISKCILAEYASRKSFNPSLDNCTLILPDKLEEWYDELYDCDEDGKVAIGLVGPTDQELAVLLLPNPGGKEEAVAFELVLVHRHRHADAQGQQERADIPDPLHPLDALGREIGHLVTRVTPTSVSPLFETFLCCTI